MSRKTGWTTRILLWCVMGGGVLASQVRLVGLDEMVERAGRIFSGTCTRIESRMDPRIGLPVVEATFLVDRTVKGNAEGQVVVRMLGSAGPAGAAEGVSGMPTFRVGEEVVLFLHDESSLGLTSPVGFLQGKFEVVRDKSGRKLAINGYRNRSLRSTLSVSLRETTPTWEHDEDLEASALLDLAESLKR